MRGLLAPLIKLIVFLIVTAFATYVLAGTISNASYGSTNTFKADFTDASGLQNGDDVRIAGVRVGTVTGIKVVHHNTAQVTFTVIKDRPLPKSVHATLRYRNLVGQRYIDISQGTGDPNDLMHKGDVIPTDQTTNSLDLTVLFAGFQPLFQGLNADQLNALSGEIISALQGEGGSLELLLSNLGDLTNSLADKDQVIGDVVDNLAVTLNELGSRDTQLSNLIVQLQGFVSGLAQDRTQIGNAIDGINTLTTTTSSLLAKARPPLAEDIKQLLNLSKNLNLPDSQKAIAFVLANTPNTIAALIRTASYGSWFNFYLCTLSGTLTLPGGAVVHIPVTHSPAARCDG